MGVNDRPEIAIAIADLVIEGVPGLAGDEVAHALRRELGELLASWTPERLQSIRAPLAPVEMRVAPGTPSATFGRQLAHTLHGALGRR